MSLLVTISVIFQSVSFPAFAIKNAETDQVALGTQVSYATTSDAEEYTEDILHPASPSDADTVPDATIFEMPQLTSTQERIAKGDCSDAYVDAVINNADVFAVYFASDGYEQYYYVNAEAPFTIEDFACDEWDGYLLFCVAPYDGYQLKGLGNDQSGKIYTADDLGPLANYPNVDKYVEEAKEMGATAFFGYSRKNGNLSDVNAAFTINPSKTATMYIHPTITNATVAYACYSGKDEIDDISLIQYEEEETIFNFASDDSNGYSLFFVKPDDGYAINGLGADQSGKIYPLDGDDFGSLVNYPHFQDIVEMAKEEGYYACFGYSRQNGNVSDVNVNVVVYAEKATVAFRLKPELGHSKLSYFYYTDETDFNDIQFIPLTDQEELAINPFATKDKHAYIVFVSAAENHYSLDSLRINGTTSRFYNIESGEFEQKHSYPGIDKILQAATDAGYEACFGYSRADDNLADIDDEVEIITYQNAGSMKVMPKLEHCEAGYIYYNTEDDLNEIHFTEVTSDTEILIDEFVTRDKNGYLLFVIRPDENYLLTGLGASGNDDLYTLDTDDFGLINVYPGIKSLAEAALAEGYSACFGYSRTMDEVQDVNAEFIAIGEKPDLNLVAYCDKEVVQKGETVTFTSIITPESVINGTIMDPASLTINSINLNMEGLKEGEYLLVDNEDGSYTLTIQYTATENDLKLGGIKMAISATTIYHYDLNIKDSSGIHDVVTTTSEITESGEALCIISEKKGILYQLSYANADGIDAANYPEIVSFIPSDENRYEEGDSVHVSDSLKDGDTIIDDVNGGQWVFSGWYYNGTKADDTITMGQVGIELTGTWTFVKNEESYYTVEYYYETEGTYGEPARTEIRVGKTDETETLKEEDKIPTISPEKYKLDDRYTANYSGVIVSNNSMKLKVYFKEQFSVKYELNNGSSDHTITYGSLDYDADTPIIQNPEREDYVFAGWDKEIEQKVTNDVMYTALWKGFTVKKEISNLPSRGYFKKGETAVFTVTVTNTGDVDLTDITVQEALDKAVFEESERYTANQDGSITIHSLKTGESASITISYVVTSSDALAASLTNTVTASIDGLTKVSTETVDTKYTSSGGSGGSGGSSGGSGGSTSSSSSSDTGKNTNTNQTQTEETEISTEGITEGVPVKILNSNGECVYEGEYHKEIMDNLPEDDYTIVKINEEPVPFSNVSLGKDESTLPKTGDHSFPYTFLFISSLIGMIVLRKREKRGVA